MLELRERNGQKHIVSDEEMKAFAWAGYHAQYSDILINGKEYNVVHVTNSSITMSNGAYLPVGCYAIFKSDDGTKIYDDRQLRNIRNNNPLESHIFCFNDDTFLKTA